MISKDAKLNAYQEAIDHLRLAEPESPDEQRAFEWLAAKLDKEAQRWWNKLK